MWSEWIFERSESAAQKIYFSIYYYYALLLLFDNETLCLALHIFQFQFDSVQPSTPYTGGQRTSGCDPTLCVEWKL